METEENVRRFWAFISYSHADKPWADWLHKALENYPMPRDLVGKPCQADAPIPKRFVPVFRDREELPTATDLGAIIAKALLGARFLVVICSPKSAKSQWVEKEIVEYKRLHGEDRVLCLIVVGEPWASDGKPGFSPDDECFPRAVRHRLDAQGELSDVRTEPIAADAREGKDGKENAVIKLMAGLLGVGFDDLRRREHAYQRQRVRRFQLTSAVFALLFIAAIAAAAYAVSQKRAVQRTLSQADLQLAVQARDADDLSRSAAYLARSLRSNPENRAAAIAAYSFLAHHKMHPPVGAVLRHPAGVNAAFGTADGKAIVVAAGDQVFVWSGPDHRLLRSRSLDGTLVRSLAAMPSGKGFVAGTAKGMIHFLDLTDLKPLREPVDTAAPGVTALAWNPAGDVLAAGLTEIADGKQGGGTLLRMSADGTVLSRSHLENLSPEIVAWSNDGIQLATGGSSPYFYVCSGSGQNPEVKELKSKLAVSGLSFTAAGVLRVIDIYNGLAEWNPSAAEAVGRPISLAPVPTRVAFSPDGTRFLGSRRGPSAYIYEAKTGAIPTEPIAMAFTVTNGVWLDADHVLLYGENGLAQVHQVRPAMAAAKPGIFRTGYPDVTAVSPDGKVLAACYSDDSLVRLFDFGSLKEIGRPLRFPSNPHAITFLADGKTLAAVCWDGKIHRVGWRRALVFESSAEPVIPVIEDSFSQFDELRFNPQGTLAALPDETGVTVLDLAAGTVRNRIPIESGSAAAAWSADGSALAAVSRTQVLRIFKPDGSPAPGYGTAKLNAPVVDLAWSPDGKRIAALTNSDRVEFFDPVTGNPTAVNIPTGASSGFIQWISDAWLLTADMDNNLKLWDPETGLAVAKLPKIGEDPLRPQWLRDRNEVLLAVSFGFARVPVPLITPTPDWLPAFLEAVGGSRLATGKNEPLLDPDAWFSPASRPAATGNDPVWEPLREWLLDSRPDRPVAPGSDMTEPQAAKIIAAADQTEIIAMRKQMDRLWKTNDSAKMAEALELLDKVLEIDPNLSALHQTRLKIRRFLNKPDEMRDAELGIAAAADSTLLEVLAAKTGAAREILRISPPDVPAARKLVEEVLAEDPDNADAKETLEAIKKF